ncbi:hypothetical protein ACOMHN_063173 [Nucella lapillus]
MTLKTAHCNQQTFVRSADKSAKEEGSVSDLAVLQKQMSEIQSEVNTALTVLVDKEKAASVADGKQQTKKATEDQDEDEDDDDDDENMEENQNGSGEPPEKRKKAS